METIFPDLLVLMIVVWTAAVLLGFLGLPRIMGELVMGVVIGPALLGWVEPSETIEVLAEMGIFFLMLHTGVVTKPSEFFTALKSSVGVAVVGAIVPFAVAFSVATAFGASYTTALFVGLTMTATAVVVTLNALRDLGLSRTRVASIVIASCVLDDLLTLILFSVAIGVVEQGAIDPWSLVWIACKATLFFAVTFTVGRLVYPLFSHPFRNRNGKGFTFLLVLGLAFGLFAEWIGLHMILGAYLAGLFFRDGVASGSLMVKVEDRLNGIAYSFLGPIFFISLGFHVDLEALRGPSLGLALCLTALVAAGQIVSAGGMARRMGLSRAESLGVGVGMCGRAEMALILSSLGLELGALDGETFSALILTAFLLNLLTPLGLKLSAPHILSGGMQAPPPGPS